MKIIQSFLLISLLLSFVLTAYPVVILHGIGDSCNGGYMRYFPQKLNQTLGVYGECIESGGGVEDFSTPIIEQSKKACEAIKANPNFQGNFSIVALSLHTYIFYGAALAASSILALVVTLSSP